jgi:5-dehydro-2-deoxygluconokinase
MSDAPLELITIGRISVDLYADEPGASFDGPQRFVKSIGGTATNVAVAAARLGHHAAVVTKVGDDRFGTYVRRKLAELGVDTSFVGTDPTLPTPLAFAALTPPEDPELFFYRRPAAPDMQLTPEDIDLDAVCATRVLWVAGSAMAEEPARSTIVDVLTARAHARHIVVDLDYRPMLWGEPAEAARVIGAAAGQATVAIGNRAECAIAVGTSDPQDAARRLLDAGVSIAVVKLGAEGVLVATPDEVEVVPPRLVEVVCGLGAGDAFGGAFVHGLLEGWSPVHTVAYANAAGAIVAGRLMCADAMPTTAEIDELMEAR